jgi:hypothetical protein
VIAFRQLKLDVRWIERINASYSLDLSDQEWPDEVELVDYDDSFQGASFVSTLRAVCQEEASAKFIESLDSNYEKHRLYQNETNRKDWYGRNSLNELSHDYEKPTKSAPTKMSKNINEWGNDFKTLLKVSGKGCENPEKLLDYFKPAVYVQLSPRSNPKLTFFVVGFKECVKPERFEKDEYKVSPWRLDRKDASMSKNVQ